MSYIMELTVAWGHEFIEYTYDQMKAGIAAPENSGYTWRVPPIEIARAQFYRILSRLKEKGAILVESVERKYTRLRLNLGWIPQEGVMSPILAVSKRRRRIEIEEGEGKSEFDQQLDSWSQSETRAAAEEQESWSHGDTSLVSGGDSLKRDSFKKDEVTTVAQSAPARAGLAIPKRKMEAGKVNHSPRKEEISECLSPAAPPARAVAVETPAEIIQRVRAEHAEARAQRTEKVRHGDHARDYEMTFRDAWLEAYPGQSVPTWTQKDCYILRNVLKARFRDNVVRRHEFLAYTVKNWPLIMTSYFSWMTQSRPPEMPSLNFLVREQFINHFLDAFAASGRDQALQLLPAEERELATLEAGGMTREKALLKIGERRALSKVADKEKEVRQINREALLAAGDARKAREEAQRAEMRRRAEAARQAPSQAAPAPFEELQGLPDLKLIELPPLDLSKWN
ncbi:hypothetical protein V5F72_00765 [Xanthobacter flavus]|uniref:hypothetical protein n=1 Tax=Xanthobacter flavus TaxID=281 RepID=UPI00372BDAE3